MTAMPAPFFSIIVPTLNSGPKLEATLRSVFAETAGDSEILVMDGGSTDGTPDLLRRLQSEYEYLTWRSGPDTGVYDAMNKGIALASGSYLYFAGAGDRLCPGALARIRAAAPQSGPALVYGDVRIVSSDRLHGGGGPYDAARLIYDAPCHQAVFYARPLFALLGLYETQYTISADWAFNMRCIGQDRVRTVYVPGVVADFEGGGLSSHGPDTAFLRDRPQLVRDRLGLDLRGDRFFAADQTLALRIAGTRRRPTRKFWRVGRWALHRLRLHSGRDMHIDTTTMKTADQNQKRPMGNRNKVAIDHFAARLLRFIGKRLWRFGSTRKGLPQVIPLPELLGGDSKSGQQMSNLSVPTDWTISDGRRLRNPFLAAALAGDELGTWALDAQTINFLEQQVFSLHPKAILEFGAGISTICLARFMQEQGHQEGPVIFSIEQNEWELTRTRARLTDLGLGHLVTIVHAPLKIQRVAGLTTECYDLTPAALQDFFQGMKPEVVIIDGPAGDDTVRYGTLPLVREYLAPNAAFFLDDAFRPEEVEVARRWSALPYVHISGAYRVGKGLLTGTAGGPDPE